MSANALPEPPAAPLWLLAELTYACPLQCPYCSNPVNYAAHNQELSTDEWVRVLRQARQLGAVQLGLSGGEPAVRQDLEELVSEARALGFYSNLITSGRGLDAQRLRALKDAGLDHVQLSFQAADATLNDAIAGTRCFEHKLSIAREIKALGYPMVLCFVLHRGNLHQVGDMLRLAEDLGADYVELANTQYYGWAFQNRDQLMPTAALLADAEFAVTAYRNGSDGEMQVYYVVPDYFETRPKACMNGWGTITLVIAADGTALPCHAAGEIPQLDLPNIRLHDLEWIWRQSPGFNRFRGEAWMKPPCRNCPERAQDFGGCRCQALLVTGDPANTDPVCSLSPHHHLVELAIDPARLSGPFSSPQLLYRNPRNSKASCPPSKPATMSPPGKTAK